MFSGIHTCRPTGRSIESVNTIGFSIMVPFSSLRVAMSLRGSSPGAPKAPAKSSMLVRSD